VKSVAEATSLVDNYLELKAKQQREIYQWLASNGIDGENAED